MQNLKDFLFSILTNFTRSYVSLRRRNIEAEDLNDFVMHLVSVQGLSERVRSGNEKKPRAVKPHPQPDHLELSRV